MEASSAMSATDRHSAVAKSIGRKPKYAKGAVAGPVTLTAVRKAALHVVVQWLEDPDGGMNALNEKEEQEEEGAPVRPIDPTDYGSKVNFEVYVRKLE